MTYGRTDIRLYTGYREAVLLKVDDFKKTESNTFNCQNKQHSWPNIQH